MPTIHDIARLAGVSITTVSKVLNGYPDVGDKTRTKILRITQEVGYQPNTMARGLAMKCSWLIGVFFQDAVNSGLEHPFFVSVINGCKTAVGKHGYDLLFFGNLVFALGDAHNNYLSRATQRHVDGVILMGIHRSDQELQRLVKAGFPCMCVDIDLIGPRSGYVQSNNFEGAKQAIRYLLSLGHRRIGVIAEWLGTKPGDDRLDGAREALREAGLDLSDGYLVYGDYSQQSGFQAMLELLLLPQRPTAVFAMSDLMGFGAIEAAQSKGLQVPADISVMGFDDIQLASRHSPSLTTIHQHMEQIGRKAGEALIELIENETQMPPVIKVDTDLIIRESCGAPPHD